MAYRKLQKSEAAEIIRRFEAAGKATVNEESLSDEEGQLRGYFAEKFPSKGPIGQSIDYELGMDLYTNLLCIEQIGLRQASDDGFWRNLTCRVIPDYVYMRWSKVEDDQENGKTWKHSRFYSKPQRNWLKIIWWMHHLSWQGDKNNTEKTLKNFGSDAISQVVERTGSGGYPVDLYRKITARAGTYENQTEAEGALRRAMKLNTMKMQTLIPEFCEGGLSGYVDSLFIGQ